MKLKPYPEYKDSGVDWLGEIPKHWEVRRIKQICRFAYGDSLPNTSRTNGNVPVYGSNGIIGKHNESNTLSPCLIIGRKGSFGKINYSKKSCFAIDTTYFIDKRYTSNNIRYLFYLLRWANLDSISKDSAIPGLSRGDAYKTLLPYCSIDEQQKISKFLDTKTEEISRFIANKRRLIELLKEQKQAIINKAVTKGITPDVKLKPSGVEWLGEVPEGWEILPIKRQFRCLNHKRIPLSAVERGKMQKRLYPYYGASGIIDKVDDYLFDDELLLIAEDGANLVLRNLKLVIIARGKFWVNNHAHILKPINGNIEFLSHILERLDYRPWISGAAQPKLTKERLMNIYIAVPKPEEQDRIIEHIKKQTKHIEITISRAEQEIGLMEEYRVRLISDVVTGAVDVRGVETSQVGKKTC
jgi:type I restriction enzyme S subunit